MDKKTEKLQKRLAALQLRLHGLNERKLAPELLKLKLRQLSSERTEIECALIDRMIENGEPYRADI